MHGCVEMRMREAECSFVERGSWRRHGYVASALVVETVGAAPSVGLVGAVGGTATAGHFPAGLAGGGHLQVPSPSMGGIRSWAKVVVLRSPPYCRSTACARRTAAGTSTPRRWRDQRAWWWSPVVASQASTPTGTSRLQQAGCQTQVGAFLTSELPGWLQVTGVRKPTRKRRRPGWRFVAASSALTLATITPAVRLRGAMSKACWTPPSGSHPDRPGDG